jgi:hypothetical protein
MEREKRPHSCGLAKPTQRLEWPLWIDAWSWDWSCLADGTYRPVRHPEACRTCELWEARATVRLEPDIT